MFNNDEEKKSFAWMFYCPFSKELRFYFLYKVKNIFCCMCTFKRKKKQVKLYPNLNIKQFINMIIQKKKKYSKRKVKKMHKSLARVWLLLGAEEHEK